MKVDISDVIRINGASMKLDVRGEPPEKEPVSGCAIDGDLDFSGILTNMNGIMHLEGHLRFAYNTLCYRCLGKIRRALDLKIEEDFTSSADVEESDMYPFEGKILDIGRALNDNIILNLPMKHLCSEKCKGLCNKCGANLNEVECGCGENDIDPRLEGLKEILRQL